MIYTLWNTYPNHPLIVEKVILNVFYSAPNLVIDKPMVISSIQTAHLLNNDTWNLEIIFEKRGKNKHTCLIFDNDFLASSKQMKLCTTEYIFPIKHGYICNYNLLCFMSIGLMLDNTIMNIFSENTKKSMKSHQNHFFHNPGWYNSLVQSIDAGFYTEKKKCWYKKDNTFA